MYCYNCGKQISDGSTFCSYCGQKQPANNRFQEEKKTKPFVGKVWKVVVKWILNIVIAFSAFVVILQFSIRSNYDISTYQSETYQNGTDANGYPHFFIEMSIDDKLTKGKLCSTFITRDFVINDSHVKFYYPYTKAEIGRLQQDVISQYHKGNMIYMALWGGIAIVAFLFRYWLQRKQIKSCARHK